MSDITDVHTGLYRIPNEESLDDATQSFGALELVVVTIEAGGETGVGFTYTIGEGGRAVVSFLDQTVRPLLEGAPAAPRTARQTLRAETTFVGREGISELALSAVDIALWDAFGKRQGAPLYELLGGSRRVVPAYLTDGGWLQYDRETLVDNAVDAAQAGFAGIKLKVGRGNDEDERRVRAVDEAVPASMDLMVDANCAYTVPDARRLATRLADVDLAWLEEPLEKGDYAAYTDLRKTVSTPLAAGENYYSPTQFKQAVTADALDVLQPDVCRIGGVTPWATVAEFASAWDLPVVPHYVEPLHVHLAAAFPNVPYIERHSRVLDRVLADPIEPSDGTYRPPETPGHGMTFSGLSEFHVIGDARP